MEWSVDEAACPSAGFGDVSGQPGEPQSLTATKAASSVPPEMPHQTTVPVNTRGRPGWNTDTGARTVATTCAEVKPDPVRPHNPTPAHPDR